jgi:hypothetical protein
MRDFLDMILDFIDSESLTDEEFEALPEGLTAQYTEDVYLALKEILTERESVSDQLTRLKLFFMSKGIALVDTAAVDANSNIFIGSKL